MTTEDARRILRAYASNLLGYPEVYGVCLQENALGDPVFVVMLEYGASPELPKEISGIKIVPKQVGLVNTGSV